MGFGRKPALIFCLSIPAILLTARLHTSTAFTLSHNYSINSHKTIAMNKITAMFSQRQSSSNTSTECPEISTTPKNPTNEVAILASGWFWHPQRDFRRLGGVVDVVVGYTGGRQKNPTYSNIMDSTEAFLVEFDPSVISYEAILDEVSSVLVIWASYHAVIGCDTYIPSLLCTLIYTVGSSTCTILPEQMSIPIGHLLYQRRATWRGK